MVSQEPVSYCDGSGHGIVRVLRVRETSYSSLLCWGLSQFRSSLVVSVLFNPKHKQGLSANVGHPVLYLVFRTGCIIEISLRKC